MPPATMREVAERHLNVLSEWHILGSQCIWIIRVLYQFIFLLQISLGLMNTVDTAHWLLRQAGLVVFKNGPSNAGVGTNMLSEI
jgi:hypothetical protein